MANLSTRSARPIFKAVKGNYAYVIRSNGQVLKGRKYDRWVYTVEGEMTQRPFNLVCSELEAGGWLILNGPRPGEWEAAQRSSAKRKAARKARKAREAKRPGCFGQTGTDCLNCVVYNACRTEQMTREQRKNPLTYAGLIQESILGLRTAEEIENMVTLRGAVETQMFCRKEDCGRILDMRTAVLVRVEDADGARSAACICPQCFEGTFSQDALDSFAAGAVSEPLPGISKRTITVINGADYQWTGK